MDFLNSLLIGIPVFIILLGPLMFIHELGHFLAAKKAGIRVEEFGMGFPPRAVRLFKRGETEYTLNWLPIGAFVRMTGEEDPSDPRSFAAASKKWRLITLAAGPIMNFIGGFVILALAYSLFATTPTEFQFRIQSVNADSAAQTLGLQAGDLILSVNGMSMTQRMAANSQAQPQANALREQTQRSIGKPIEFVVLRQPEGAGKPHQVTLTGQIPATANPNTPLGVSLTFNVTKSERMAIPFLQALQLAGQDVANVISGFVRVPIDLIEQRIPAEQARPVGPIGITNIGVTLIEERATQGLFPFIRFAGFLSIILGITNLLPIPALDGGRMLFILIEILRGKRVDPQREQWVHAIGMMIILGLSAVIVVLDIINPVSIR